jgi:hypothetical protein
MAGPRGRDTEVRAAVGDERAHHLRVGIDELDRRRPALARPGQHVGHERLGGRVTGRQPHERTGVADPGHDLADLVGQIEQRPGMAVEPAPRGGQRDAAWRALEQLRADLRLERREPLGQRGLRHVQAHRRAAEGSEVGGNHERAQLVEVRSHAQPECTRLTTPRSP